MHHSFFVNLYPTLTVWLILVYSLLAKIIQHWKQVWLSIKMSHISLWLIHFPLFVHFLSLKVLPVLACIISCSNSSYSCGAESSQKIVWLYWPDFHFTLDIMMNLLNIETASFSLPIFCHHLTRLWIFLVKALRQMFPWRQTNTMVAKLLPVSMDIWYAMASDPVSRILFCLLLSGKTQLKQCE